MDALGLVELYGFSVAIVAADAAAKAADVKIIALDNSKPANGDDARVPLVMAVKMEGSVSAVKAGVEAAVTVAKDRDLYITSSIIARPGYGIEKLAARSHIKNSKIMQKKAAKKSVRVKEKSVKDKEESAQITEKAVGPGE